MLNKRLIAGVLGAALAVTTICPMTSFAAKKVEDLLHVEYSVIEGTDEQHELAVVDPSIILTETTMKYNDEEYTIVFTAEAVELMKQQGLEIDGLKFKDMNKNGLLDAYEDWRLDAETRTADLMSQMTIREKVAQMQHPTFVPKANGTMPNYLNEWCAELGVGFLLVRELIDLEDNDGNLMNPAAEVAAENMNQIQAWAEESRLGVPVVVSMDSVHGTSYVKGATVTPHNLGLAATRDVELVSELADIARQEHIAVGARMTLSPEADVATEPRWGRVMETFGEDVDLVTEMTVAQVIAFQAGDTGLNEDSIIACMKHFPGAGPQMEGVDASPIVSSEESMQEHLKPYKAAIEVGLASVMPYYSIPLAIDTVAALGSEATLQDLLRGELGFDGIIQTDWGMIWAIQQSASLFGDEVSDEEAVIIGVMDGGVDGIGGESITLIDTMEEMVGDGRITEEVVDAACHRILRAKFQLGVFENPYVDAEYAKEYVGCEENQAVSLRAAEESMTLLKNDGILPLEEGKYQRILVCGDRAGDMDSLCGGWSSLQPGLCVWEAVEQYAGEGTEIVYVANDIDQIKEEAAKADLVICAIGEASYMHKSTWTEESNRLDVMESPAGGQGDMLLALKEVGTPVVTVVITGRPIVLTWCDENTNAILMAYYPGSQGGIAIAETLFGINNPTGKLPIQMPRTWESAAAQEGDIAFDLEDPLYDYGFGLSYE